MQDLPACVSFEAPDIEVQKKWLRRTRIPLATISFGTLGILRAEDGSLAQLPIDDPECLRASETTLQAVIGLEYQAVMPEQFAAFCRRFVALQELHVDLPTDSGDVALQSLPPGLKHLAAHSDLSSFQVPLSTVPFTLPMSVLVPVTA